MLPVLTESSVHMTLTDEIKALNDAHVINTYGERTVALSRGEGMLLWDAEGKEYLDFFAGIAVCNLGHCHPAVTQAICDQAKKLVHVSNLYYIEAQTLLAAALCKHSFAEKWFFCNGGAEANEAAIKLARRYWEKQGTPKPGIVTAQQSFHGRTIATVTATGQPKYHDGFQPLVPGFSYVPYNDLAALEAAITPDVGAVLLEPIQGEGGVRVPDDCLDLLVEAVRGSVRDLEGALIQLVTTAALLKRSIDLELTRMALHKLAPVPPRKPHLEPEKIIDVVAGFFGTNRAALASRSRRRDVLVPRQLAMYLCRRYTDHPLSRIARAFDRDHPAVSNAVKVVERKILERAPLRYQVEELSARLDRL